MRREGKLLILSAAAYGCARVVACENKKDIREDVLLFGAGDEARTRYLHLGKVALYQMSYARGTVIIIRDKF